MLKADFRSLAQVLIRRNVKLDSWACAPYTCSKRAYADWTTPRATPKPYYVTTPIFYVNAGKFTEPHIGHLYSMILADVLKRWQVLLGNVDAKLLTGTDEHGIKVQQAALQKKMKPQDFCDNICRSFKELANEANISNDYFIRTTNRTHKSAVQFLWENLNHRGYIYEGKHEGWYSVSDEAFYPSSAVQAILDPATGRKITASIETGKEVEWSQETNYHFRLSAFRDRLLEHYKQNPNFIRPKAHMESTVKSVAKGLQDLSISRPVERLSWGVPVPGDQSQTIYVWLDALVNYLTYAGYPFTPGSENTSIWPPDVQVIGKDITRFHSIYWPAFLMALDLPLPGTILTHAHWTMNKAKMSKSTGNVVNPLFALARFGVDPLRFFLILNGPFGKDSDYENSLIVRDYKNLLQDQLGNLCSRVLRSKLWDARELVLAGTSPNNAKRVKRDAELQHIEFLEGVVQRVSTHMNVMNSNRALEQIMTIAVEANGYMQRTKPWIVAAESRDPKEIQEDLIGIIFVITESLRITGILLQPFMPKKAKQLLDTLGVDDNIAKRSFAATAYGSDPDYMKGGAEKGGILFPPFICEN